jgi:hypothetical protein
VREQIYQYGLPLMRRFFEANGISIPAFYRYSDTHLMTERMREELELKSQVSDGASYGLYFDSNVFVNVTKSRLPVQNPGGMAWSYPCWKTDRTAIGILAHECGHHADEETGLPGRSKQWKEVCEKGRKLTSYEPKIYEAWAETMRLFILNPDLLRLGIPHRYKFITEVVKLIPSETRPWQEVLYNHTAYVYAGEKWIKKGD